MRLLTLTITLLTVASHTLLANTIYPVSKLEQHLEKSKACKMAIATVDPMRVITRLNDKEMYLDSRYASDEEKKHFSNIYREPEMSSSVTCLQDLTSNPGTINEKRGCAFANYNSENDQYTISYITNLPCDKGGVKALFQQFNLNNVKQTDQLIYKMWLEAGLPIKYPAYAENSYYQCVLKKTLSYEDPSSCKEGSFFENAKNLITKDDSLKIEYLKKFNAFIKNKLDTKKVAEVVTFKYNIPQDVQGIIIQKTFFGPPNYGDDPQHDQKIPKFLIKLNSPSDFTKDPKDQLNENEKGVSEIQLSFDSKKINLKQFLNKKVKVHGTFSHAMSPGEYTKVIGEISTIKNND